MPLYAPAAAPRYAATITGSPITVPNEASAGALAKLAINTVALDTNSWWDSTAKRYIPKVAGRYLVTCGIDGLAVLPSGTLWCDLSPALNGVAAFIMRMYGSSSSAGPGMRTSAQIVVNGSTDYIEMWGGTFNAGSVSVTARMDIVYMGPQ